MTVILKHDEPAQEEKFKNLIKKFIKYGSFKLNSGRYSDKYFDIKSLFCNGTFALYAAKCIRPPNDLKFIGGLEFGAIQFATAISISFYYVPSFIVRKQTKNYGLGGRVVSYEKPMVGKCLLVDDVVTTGSSIDECVRVLKEERHELEIDSIVCIVDRTRGEYTKYPIVSFYKEEDFE